MTDGTLSGGGAASPSASGGDKERRYCAWFSELDAWTEYWDIYHPESHGRFYFGDGDKEPGLLHQFVPRDRRPAAFSAWTQMALQYEQSGAVFAAAVRVPQVAAAVMEIDALLSRLFAKHFGDAADARIQRDYLEAIFRFATDTLPPATERTALIPDGDPRKSTAGSNTLDGDLMWFAWALQLEAAHAIVGKDHDHARRALLLAGVATGCPANFAWRGHRRTRPEYSQDARTELLLRERGTQWTSDFAGAAAEVHALFRIREWGHDD